MRLVLLALTIVLSMFPVVLAAVPRDDEYLFAKVALFLGDVPALLLTVVAAPVVVRRLRARPAIDAPTLWAALLVVLLAAFAFHPSAEGVRTLARAAMALAIIVTVADARARAERRLVVGALAIIAVVQAALAFLQAMKGAPLGLDMLGEWQAPLVTAGNVGTIVAPEGTMQHPHLLASLSLVAALAIARQLIGGRESGWSPALLLAVAPVGFTYARAAALGLGIACAILARGAFRRGALARSLPVGVASPDLAPMAARSGRFHQRLALGLLVVGFSIPALLGLEGWTIRAAVGGDPSERDVVLRQAAALVAEHPLTGVGPGRELLALRELREREPAKVAKIQAVHMVPMTTAVEAGIPGGVAMLAVIIAAGVRAVRSGGATLALFAAYVPFLFLDHFPYTHQHGLVLTAVWLGLLDDDPERSAP